MMKLLSGSDPILDCAAAAAFEQRHFGGDETREWAAMRRAGAAVAVEFLGDLRGAGIAPDQPARVLVLVGKGHNGGDALLAAATLLDRTSWSFEVGFVFGQNQLRPLAQAAWQTLQHAGVEGRLQAVRRAAVTARDYDAVLDGVFGFQFRPPLPERARAWFAAAASPAIRFRGAVDLPSGLDDPDAFEADATYATGIFKTPLLELPGAGRLRYLGLDFFPPNTPGQHRVLTSAVLEPLRRLRPARCDKRTFGQLAIIGGSRAYPGAIGLSLAAALHAGVGNITAFVPESQAASFAARWPEAMWMGCPETEEGSISLDAGLDIRRHLQRATAVLIGPGLGREPETLALVAELIRESAVPLVLDADALQPDLVRMGDAPRVLTPHAGEYQRLKLEDEEVPPDWAIVRKGPVTCVEYQGVTYHALEGGPVLARGGSGDMLAGLISGCLAAASTDVGTAAVRGTYWHGRAARLMAERWGEVAVRNSALIDEINPALRGESPR
jgi:ADP-dependent NAD(P)H-hydrate dehydratase / NAD(P)H-hydrate epimerase